jgi:hypothetical protein
MRVELPPPRLETVRPQDVNRGPLIRASRPTQHPQRPPFERVCTELLASERAVSTVIRRLQSGRGLSPGQLLEAQVAVYHNLQRVEFLSKCLQAAQSTLQQLRQG